MTFVRERLKRCLTWLKLLLLPAVDSNVPNSYVNDDGEANLDRSNVRNENPVRLAVVILW
jgi:hypothetical protein